MLLKIGVLGYPGTGKSTYLQKLRGNNKYANIILDNNIELHIMKIDIPSTYNICDGYIFFNSQIDDESLQDISSKIKRLNKPCVLCISKCDEIDIYANHHSLKKVVRDCKIVDFSYTSSKLSRNLCRPINSLVNFILKGNESG